MATFYKWPLSTVPLVALQVGQPALSIAKQLSMTSTVLALVEVLVVSKYICKVLLIKLRGRYSVVSKSLTVTGKLGCTSKTRCHISTTKSETDPVDSFSAPASIRLLAEMKCHNLLEEKCIFPPPFPCDRSGLTPSKLALSCNSVRLYFHPFPLATSLNCWTKISTLHSPLKVGTRHGDACVVVVVT